jgi:PadR family transcriptional regulator PadR
MTARKKMENGPVGNFEEQVLLAVLRTGDEAYGMAVRREIETVTKRSVTIGSVYVTLDRLEAKGLVTSTRMPAAGASSRRVFAVTAAGQQALAATKALHERLWRGVRLQPARGTS